ncbi:hypothetical protein L1987_61012 [Smallanthus sonchifolius]|uniref:Uncharacterized protein n=1 Tax=Smallanthus sonchifolius TaxID=185202 RepID=A0ACB9DA07_9ASTR|nr:hypothetical protein L1987_61012 [Smallanthus sonchifolius]
MGRNLSQMVRWELENLDQGQESRKSAMKILKSYVKDLDSKTIPIFLAQVFETKETDEFVISLYEDIARVHGAMIIPHIDNIMLMIIKGLSSSPGSLALHQACVNVVSAIARYGMDPTTPDAKKQEVVHSICKPLSGSLLARQESLSSGAAFCLKALVELDDWRFCSSQTVNEVCQRVVAGLESLMQVDSHMGLVMVLAKRNGLVVEGYARLLVRAGVRILNMGVTEENYQKRLSAIRMVNCLLRSLDYKSIMTELTFVIEEFQKFQHDQMADVKEAAFEAIRTAKRMLWSNVDVSLKDGLFSGQMSSPRSAIERSEAREDHEDGFTGFLHRSPINGDPRSATPSPQRSRSYVNVDNTNHFTTPRKLVKSPHVPDIDCSKSQSRRFRSPSPCKFNRRPDSNYDQNGFNEGFSIEDEQFDGTSELVSSTEAIPSNGSNSLQQYKELIPETQVKSQILSAVSIYYGLFVLLVAVVCYLWICDVDEGYNLVPT